MRPFKLALLAAALSMVGTAHAGRFIIQVKHDSITGKQQPKAATLQRLSTQAGQPLSLVRPLATGAWLVTTPAAGDNATVLQRLRQDSSLAYAVEDTRRYVRLSPVVGQTNDPLFSSQWSLSSAEFGGAWQSLGWLGAMPAGNGPIVAVVDTGIRRHADLDLTRLLPGYDFVSADQDGKFLTANDGDGRDSDPQDPGDWVSSDDAKQAAFSGCEVSDSSWHGTFVSSLIIAQPNNGKDLAGSNWSARVLPVRALGKCGGYLSDITEAALWAGGVHVAGVPDNATPAQVVNLSLGSTEPCSAAEQDYVNQLRQRGVTVVVAAGNEASASASSAPGNCVGVVNVAATTSSNGLASYSNHGAEVTLSAPGGDRPTAGLLLGLGNAGKTSPGADTVVAGAGTSFASPLTASAVAMALSVRPSLSVDEIKILLQSSASLFPANSSCSMSQCGAGGLNAFALVQQAQYGWLPNVGVDAWSGSNASSRSYSFKNLSAQAQSVSSVTLQANTESSRAAFKVTQDGCTGKTLNAGESCTVQVGLGAANTFSAEAQLVLNGSLGSGAVKLRGDNLSNNAPNVQADKTMVAFADTAVNSRSAEQMVLFTNMGDSSVRVVQSQVSAGFALQTKGCVNVLLAPKASCQVGVVFQPTAQGTVTGTLTVELEGGLTLNLPLTGVATAASSGGSSGGGGGGGCAMGQGRDASLVLLLLAAVLGRVTVRRGARRRA